MLTEMTIKSATMLVFNNTQSNPQTKRKKNTDKPSPGPKTTRFQQPVLESLAFCRDGKIFSQDPPISFHHFLQGFFAPVTIIERTLSFLITLLLYSRPKKTDIVSTTGAWFEQSFGWRKIRGFSRTFSKTILSFSRLNVF